jgi:hypothetical protein
MSGAAAPPAADDMHRRELAVFISIRTILLVGVAVALAWAAGVDRTRAAA